MNKEEISREQEWENSPLNAENPNAPLGMADPRIPSDWDTSPLNAENPNAKPGMS